MPLDAICLAAVRNELESRIVGMKIDKVQQPERDIIILSLRGAGEPCRLLISAGAQDARVHLTQHQFENPSSPPMFCMLLRKHLTGARILSVAQPQAERALEFELQATDAMGAIVGKRLIIELIGRISNVILTDTERIIDCLRRIGGDLSDKRAVLPGMIYRSPPAQAVKTDPYTVGEAEWQRLYNTAIDSAAEKWLLSTFTALSPLICREISWRASGDTGMRLSGGKDADADADAALRREFFKLIGAARAGAFEPWSIADDDGSPQDFSFTPIMQYEGALRIKREESFSEMLDGFFTKKTQQERVRQRASAMFKAMNTAKDRLVRKLAAQREDMAKAAQRDAMRECGDIITANFHLIAKGQSELTAQDFYRGDGAVRTIALDPLKTPQQNAAKYYKEYSKAKNTEKYLEQQIKLGDSELAYLESVVHEINLAEGERDLNEIRAELEHTGYIKTRRKTKEKQAATAPMRFTSSAGLEILAGRNNTQNDALTLKTAQKSDIWLHAQKQNGAHVIISCGGAEPDEASLLEAAAIAAYYSSGSASGKTAVDYAQVKHVKKPSGGRPGMVIYTNYKTVIVSPDGQLAEKLRGGSKSDTM